MANRYWVGDRRGDMKWTTSSNWQGGVVPNDLDNVIFSGAVSQSDCIIDDRARTSNLGIVKFISSITITIYLQTDIDFVIEGSQFGVDNTSCNVTLSGSFELNVASIKMGATIGPVSNLYLVSGAKFSSVFPTIRTIGILQHNTMNIIPSDGTTIKTDSPYIIYGTLGKANTSYILNIASMETATGFYGNLIAPNFYGSFICAGLFQVPHTYVHSGGKFCHQSLSPNDIVFPSGDFLNFFFDLEILIGSKTYIKKQIIVNGHISGSTIGDQISTGILSIQHDLTITGELHSFIEKDLILKNSSMKDTRVVI